MTQKKIVCWVLVAWKWHPWKDSNYIWNTLRKEKLYFFFLVRTKKCWNQNISHLLLNFIFLNFMPTEYLARPGVTLYGVGKLGFRLSFGWNYNPFDLKNLIQSSLNWILNQIKSNLSWFFYKFKINLGYYQWARSSLATLTDSSPSAGLALELDSPV